MIFFYVRCISRFLFQFKYLHNIANFQTNSLDAAKKLGDVEEEVGSSQTKEKAIEVRADIRKHHDTKATKLDKDILSESKIIATLDAARILAQSAAEKKQIATEKKSTKLLQEAKAIEVRGVRL